jgi:FlaG/FlaF family flagellin (archaellin)
VSAGAAAAARGVPRSVRSGRLSFGRILLVAVLVIAAALGAAVVLVQSRTPPEPAADCTTGEQCGNPPPGKPLVNGAIWTSDDLGYHFEYDEDLWEVTSEDGDGAILQVQRGGMAAIFNGAATSEADPSAAFDDAVDYLSGRLALAADTDPTHVVLGPKVGDFHADAAGVFQGSTNAGQGEVLQLRVVVMSATDGDTTVTVTLVAPDENLALASQSVDAMLNTLRFPSEPDV